MAVRRRSTCSARAPSLPVAAVVFQFLLLAAAPACLEAGGPIKTVVVVVMENRSFDHMLGWMKRLNPEIDGVTGGEWNPVNTTDPAAGRVYFGEGAQYVARTRGTRSRRSGSRSSAPTTRPAPPGWTASCSRRARWGAT